MVRELHEQASSYPQVLPPDDAPEVLAPSREEWPSEPIRLLPSNKAPEWQAYRVDDDHRVCGLRRSTFWLLVVLAVVVVVAAVGGGVGGSLAVVNAKKSGEAVPPPTSTPNPTTSPNTSSTSSSSMADATNYVAPSDVVIATSCQNKATRTISLSDGGNIDFQLECDTNRKSDDIFRSISYSLDDCLTSCAKYNQQLPYTDPTSNTTCLGVVFANDLKTYRKLADGNCFLKKKVNPSATEEGVITALLRGVK